MYAYVQAGGTALLAETDELIGAEQYVLQVRYLVITRSHVNLAHRRRAVLAAGVHI